MKIAHKNEDFKRRWIEKVSSNEGLKKAINYWVRESDRPQFLSMSD